MSRTDVHAPYWTYAVWWEPCHHLWCPNRINRNWQKRHGRVEPCNLPKRPVRHGGRRTRVHVGLCTWKPVWPSWRECRWQMFRPVPRWFIRHTWSGPERVRQRDTLSKLAKEYNATGTLADGDFPNYQTRHTARWLWD